MNRKVEAIKRFCAILAQGQASDYSATSVVGVFKEFAVKMDCAKSVEEIRANSVASILNYICDNLDAEENEPFDLERSENNATIVVKRNGKVLEDSTDILYNGDKLTITATADEGYTLDTLTVNGTDFTSGKTFTVNGHSVSIVASATETQAT